MTFTVVVNPSAFHDEVARQGEPTVRDATFDLRATIFRLFGGVKTGQYYPRPKPLSGIYRASAAGEAPAIRSGLLFRSSRITFPKSLTGQLTLDTPYAALLEQGTTRMLPRPYIAPAIKSIKEQYRGGIRRAFQ